jgi:alpha-1,2-mannosyltransferase
VLCLTIVTAAWSIQQVRQAAHEGELAEDFRTSVWNPGRALADGRSPTRVYSGETHDGGTVYPPIAAVLTFPFSLPPYRLALVLWLAALMGAVFGSLWLCGVRDWRCYLAASASPPVLEGVMYANVSVLLMLAIALAWRWRERVWLVGIVVALAVAGKLFLWPLVFWLASTRRWASAGLSIALAGAFTVAGWAAVGFDGLSEYPSLMQRNADEFDQGGASVAALAAQLGVPGNQALALAAGMAALLVAVLVRRDDLAAFTWVVVASTLASPIVWTHYYVLLLVPLALALPTWGLVWLLPYALFPQAADAAMGVVVAVALATWITARRLRNDPFDRRPLSADAA